MQPAVPFAALGVTALLAVAAWAALAAAALALRGPRPPAVLVGVAALVLGGAEVATALVLGEASSDVLVLLRGAGLLLLTAGLALGALGPRAQPPPPGAALNVVAPLAAAPAPSALAALAGMAAALQAVRSRRDTAGVVLAVGLALAAGSVAVAPLADDGPGRALAVVGLRAAGAVVVLAALALLAQSSLLAKVVAGTVAGVLVMACAAVGVVGTVVVQSYEEQGEQFVRGTAEVGEKRIEEIAPGLTLQGQQLARSCAEVPDRCEEFLRTVAQGQASFAAVVPVAGQAAFATAAGAELTAVDQLRLAQLPLVRSVQSGTVASAQVGLVRLSPETGRVAAVVAAPQRDGEGALQGALVYGQPVTDATLADLVPGEEYGVALLAGEPARVVASDGDDERAQALLDRVRTRLSATGYDRPFTLPSEGDLPTARLVPLQAGGDAVGMLAVTRSAQEALDSQRFALQSLLGSAVAVTGLVALLALLLGRRTVDPVRRLTASAQRLASGDLTEVGSGVRSRDEVGVLSRTFDTMTGALARLTGDLRRSATRLETVLASMSDGLLATDADGTVTSVNRAALEMLGRPEGEVVGRPLEDVADVRAPDGAPLADPGLRVQDAPGEVHGADGTLTPVQVSVSALRDGEGVVLVLRDTTREREVERMKTEFLSNVSHELRTPLTPIRGYADILANRPGLDSDKVTRFAGTILAESLKMNRVVDLLVDVASLEAGRVVPRPVDVDVRALLDARLEAWRAKAPERAADLRRRVATGLPSVSVDPEWLGKALDELVDNALKYSPPGAAVTLAATRAPDGERVRVAVRDAGPGIAEADQALLFTSFEQVDGSATRRVGGLGLGLSFVRRVADDAGLPLTVTSAVGTGSEFALDLPPGAPLPKAPRVSPGSRAARR